jgi:hypothetical protein
MAGPFSQSPATNELEQAYSVLNQRMSGGVVLYFAAAC